ncbi:RHS repeat-associated protein [Luteibacter sp. Sphag1AF]|nr:RHS repeat-associated protein [Luteibacter sp. Sphag1AF]
MTTYITSDYREVAKPRIVDAIAASGKRGRWRRAGILLLAALVGVPRVHATETITYYYTSPEGNLLATADAAGNVISSTDYRPYGSAALGVAAQGPGYTGHVSDIDTGLVYMQQRYYDPVIGRFLSTDPLRAVWRSPSHMSRYSYANDNPYRFIDPDGRATVAIGGTFNAAAQGGGTVTGQITFSTPSWNPATWRLGGYGSIGGLATTDIGVGGGLALSYSPADSAEEMASASSNVSAGGAVNVLDVVSVGYEQSLCTDCKRTRTLTIGSKIAIAPVEIHTSVTQSAGVTWLGSKPPQPTVTVGPATKAPPPPPPPPPQPPPNRQPDDPSTIRQDLNQ